MIMCKLPSSTSSPMHSHLMNMEHAALNGINEKQEQERQPYHRIVEYPELEESHKHHWVQLLAPHRTTHNSNCLQALCKCFWNSSSLGLWPHCPGEPVPSFSHPLGKNLFPVPNLILALYSSMSFPESRNQPCPSAPLMRSCRPPCELLSASSSLPDWTNQGTSTALHTSCPLDSLLSL